MDDNGEKVFQYLYMKKMEISKIETIKLMIDTMKLWERVIQHQLRVATTVLENQFGFIPTDQVWKQYIY